MRLHAQHSCPIAFTCSASFGASNAGDGGVRTSLKNLACSLDQSRFLDPYTTLTLALKQATPNIAAVKIWQADDATNNLHVTNITVWLHEWAQMPSSNLPDGNADSFLSGVVCASGVWPAAGAVGQPQWQLARCSQTIGTPGARYITLQKFNNYAAYASAYFCVAEVQVLADGEWL